MASTQQVIGALRQAGFVTRQWKKGVGMVRDGYEACKLSPSMVGVCCNRLPIEDVAAALMAAGFSVSQRGGTATDALFVR